MTTPAEEETPATTDREGFLKDHHLDRYEEWLDSKFRLPVIGYRVGLDGLIGLIPGIGDIVTAGVSTVFIADAWKGGARKRTMAKMAANVGVDFLVGTIPVVGDFFDFAFKSNTKNLRLLKRERAHLAAKSGSQEGVEGIAQVDNPARES